LRLTPSGHLLVSRGDGFGHALPERTAAAIEAAFESSSGHGILHLGADEPAADLGPTLGYWRDLGRLFVTRLCGLLDLQEKVRSGLDLPLEDSEEARLLASAPPMLGIEYLSADVLRRLWDETAAAFVEEARSSGKDADAFLRSRHALWQSVGKVVFHLAENKARRERPFAFLATYTARVSGAGKLQHVPLGQAVKDEAAAENRAALLALLVPVQKAAARSRFLRELVDSGRIFQPQAWTPAEAHEFLREVPLYEENGVLVRIPDWWNPRSPPRLSVAATIGRGQAAGFGADALLDFSVDLALDGEPISPAEWQAIVEGSGSLALVKGRWVEVDRERLAELLKHWKAVEKGARSGGISFLEGMRLLARMPAATGSIGLERAVAGDADGQWLQVRPGDWLRGVLEELRSPSRDLTTFREDELRAVLRPYQLEGVRWLWLLHRLRLGGCLADDMGLGKTLQVLALLVLLKRESKSQRRPSLLVLPASLIGNWRAECTRFAPGLKVLVAHPSEATAPLAEAPVGLDGFDLVITTYGMLARLAWVAEREWPLVVLDEAQAIKNPSARQTRAVKSLRSEHRLALTGTPVENRLADLWSLFDFLSPGLLGSAKEFTRLARANGDGGGGESYAQIRSLTRPYLLRRLKTDKRIIADLPEKQEVKVYCGLRRKQAVLYQEAVDELARSLEGVDGMKRRGTILAFLMRFKQICNHPAQWTGAGAYDAAESGKMLRLLELAEEMASRQEKVLVFTQFREITAVLAEVLQGAFGRPGLVLDGATAVGKRKALVEDFQLESGPPFFVLSLKAGGTGLNLTAATHVVHFDRWWNPAVENQATDRAFRIGQTRNVLVHKFVCRGTIEEKIDAMLESKQAMADEVLQAGAEKLLTEMSDEDLLGFVALDQRRAAVEE
jgi:non-specific serine/threonine protein kinase